jgi:hypothetical protein
MLAAAFIVTLIAALLGELSWSVVVGMGCVWFVKKCVQLAVAEGAFAEPNPTSVTTTGQEIMRFGIQAGLEVYSHQPLADGVRCKVVVEGIDTYLHHSGSGWGEAELDAVYLLGGGQYSRHDSLLIDRQRAQLFAQDQYRHSYSFLYTGTGRHLSMLLRIPEPHKCQHGLPMADKPLKVTLWTLTAAEETEMKAREDEQQREEAAMQREELRQQALELATLADVGSNFLNPEFQKNYAAKHTAEILKTWGQHWRQEYLALMRNEPLYALMREEHPEVLEYFTARFTVVKLAEWKAVEPTPPQPEAKPKVTPEEWAARIERYRQRSLTRKRVKVEDYKADVMQDLELLQEFIADLDNYPLDEDERERLTTEFKERLLGGEEENNNGFKQL